MSEPLGTGRAGARQSLAAHALILLLGLGLLGGLVSAGFLFGRSGRTPSPEAEFSDLPDMHAVAEAAAWAVVLLTSAVVLPFGVALLRPRPWLARAAVILVTVAWAAVSAALWADVRGNWDCAELRPSIFVAPAWLAALALLATSADGRRALALPHGPFVVAVRVLVLGVLAGLVGGNGVCLLGCERPAAASIAGLHAGQSRAEALTVLDGVCERRGGGPVDGMRFLCAPRAPAACACAPAVARTVTLYIGENDRVERWTQGVAFAGMRRPR